jgi:hypothetical protein
MVSEMFHSTPTTAPPFARRSRREEEMAIGPRGVRDQREEYGYKPLDPRLADALDEFLRRTFEAPRRPMYSFDSGGPIELDIRRPPPAPVVKRIKIRRKLPSSAQYIPPPPMEERVIVPEPVRPALRTATIRAYESGDIRGDNTGVNRVRALRSNLHQF